jgi:hypothetical protein
MTKYNLPYGSQIQGMDILHKGNHHKNKNSHPNHFYIMGGMYQTPTTQTADINNYSKIASVTGFNIIHLIVFSGVSGGSTAFGGYRITLKLDPFNEVNNVYNLEYMGVAKLGFIVVKNTSSGSTVYDIYAQTLNTGDIIYFSPLFIQSEQNVSFYGYSPFVVLPANDATHTRIFLNPINFSQKVSATLDFPSIPANSSTELTITVTGASVGDVVTASPSAGLETGLTWNCYVSATNIVTLRIINLTTAAIDPQNRAWRINWSK